MEAAEHGTKPHCLNKPPKPKGYPIQIHDGMRSTNARTGTSEWGGHGASYDANPANPLNAGPPRGKRLSPPMPSPGMRSRINENVVKPPLADESARILNEASNAKGSDAGDRARFGTLPQSTTED
jgi:hypothetical protein